MKINQQKFTTRIGLEVHLQLQTKQKLFSFSQNTFNAEPNSSFTANSYDWGYPGTLPRLNLEAVKLGAQTVFLLHGQVDFEIHFDRKNYYYFDLPKGYQITQFHRPLSKDGYLTIILPDGKKKQIKIMSIHLEEDAAKTIYSNNQILVDYNRAGIPLLEITTEPVFNSYEEVKIFLKNLVWILKTAQVSDAKFEEGSVRVDVNISHRLNDQNISCPLTEIKNLNSLKNIQKTIIKERIWQLSHFFSLRKSSTKTFDEINDDLVLVRKKFTKYDYFFMRENNIAPIQLDEIQHSNWIKTISWLLDFRIKFSENYSSLSSTEVDFILNDSILIFYFCLLINVLNDKVVVLLFLKEILCPYFHKTKFVFTSTETLLTTSYALPLVKTSSLQKHDCSFDLLKEIFIQLKISWQTPFLVTKEQDWKGELKKQNNIFWQKFNQSNNWLVNDFWKIISSQSLFIDLELAVITLRMYQQGQINFKLVKKIFLDFVFHQIIFSSKIQKTLTTFFTKKVVNSSSTLIIDFLKDLIGDDLALVQNYQKFPQKTTNYLMGQIHQKLQKKSISFAGKELTQSRIDSQSILNIIKQFFTNLKKT